jgi:hypothetical protein
MANRLAAAGWEVQLAPPAAPSPDDTWSCGWRALKTAARMQNKKKLNTATFKKEKHRTPAICFFLLTEEAAVYSANCQFPSGSDNFTSCRLRPSGMVWLFRH